MADIWVDAGEELLVDILDTSVAVPTWYCGWGTGAGTAAKADSALFTESAEARIAATLSQPGVNQSRYVATMTSASGQTITNAGILSAISSGILWLHSDFVGVLLANGDKIEFTFTVTWA